MHVQIMKPLFGHGNGQVVSATCVVCHVLTLAGCRASRTCSAGREQGWKTFGASHQLVFIKVKSFW